MEGTPILGHGREVPQWWPLFLRFAICLGPYASWRSDWPALSAEKISLSLSHLVSEILGPKVGLSFHRNVLFNSDKQMLPLKLALSVFKTCMFCIHTLQLIPLALPVHDKLLTDLHLFTEYDKYRHKPPNLLIFGHHHQCMKNNTAMTFRVIKQQLDSLIVGILLPSGVRHWIVGGSAQLVTSVSYKYVKCVFPILT